ncbi:hypothetical protein HPP92_008354 [Vanilla planifolia]|uniref:Uncharacterized protein n=1 Tax=Vanilla planifolia TaxID=51239 RepID=A0A835RA98_VANPL|nr:hypothetical protein HPP92_008354 [Vanilla planifolia]
MATSSSSSPFPSAEENSRKQLLKEIRNHEIAIGELSSLPASRAAYQKVCNIYFRKGIDTVKSFEQKKLDAAKSQLQKLDKAR